MTPRGLKHPGRWLWLFLLVPVVLGLVRLRFDLEVFDLLPDDLPAVRGLKIYQQHFANARELIMTVQSPEAEQTESAARAIAQALRQASNLVAAVTWEPPWLEHPDQAAELIAYLWLNQPPATFLALADGLVPNKLPVMLASARDQLATSMSPEEIARLSYDPFGFTRLPEAAAGAAPSFAQGQEIFSSADGKFRILFVKASQELRSYKECEQWLASVKKVIQTALTEKAHSAEGPASPSALDTLPPDDTQTSANVASVSPGNVSIGYTGRPAFVAEVAGGMEHDITTSVGGTAVIIAVLFWLAHRRIKPMLWLLTLLAVILGSTLALGGLIFGTINVISMGFAAILLGLAVDYAVVHYQEALTHPNLTIPQIRHAIAPSILWAAVTTIAAFLVLNFGGLPGLGQLGTLVGLGVGLSACIMIFEFLPPLFPGRNQVRVSPDSPTSGAGDSPFTKTGNQSRLSAPEAQNRLRDVAVIAATSLVLAFTVVVLLFGLPHIDPTANALRPRGSPAYATLDQIQAHLNQKREPLWLIVGGGSEAEVAHRLANAQSVLDRAVTNQLISSFTLPTPLWPRPEFQVENRATARALAGEREALRQAALTNGFSETALGLTGRVLDTLQTAASVPGVFWPTNHMSQWIFEKLSVHTPTNYFALGLINPVRTPDNTASHANLSILESELPHDQVWLSGWELLGSSIFSRVKANMWKVLAPMIILVLLSLWLAFKRPSEILLSVAVLLMSGLCLLTVMRLADWSWNLLNLMAIPLILGTGVDYSLFMQLALRRHHGDLHIAYRSVGRALLLCGGTAIAGFGSLAWSSNAGMASLGAVCAVGIASNMLIAIFLLPTWWSKFSGKPFAKATNKSSASVEDDREEEPLAQSPQPQTRQLPSTPSSLYRPDLWRLGTWVVRALPRAFCLSLSRSLASLYWRIARHRREVVIQNLMPALNQDRITTENTAKQLFQNFATKIVDLLRYEGGLSLEPLLGEATGWEHFEKARAENRGVLLLTPHLGNWEFGSMFMSRKGVKLQVITLAEPGENFTELRQAARARRQIDTLVIGEDPFAIVEIIRRLEAGATVALLVDRPPPPTATTVELFQHPFAASIAAAELARASGCVLLPVFVPWTGHRYAAHLLPAIPYDRAALRDRQARQQLTQAVIRAFEPGIREHLDQWYHFVPVWPTSTPR